jgi:RNA polymerase sigma factor (sigma-70 family)
MATVSEFDQLMADVADGSHEATMKLAEIYTPYIIRSVRRCFSPKMRQKFDSQDVAQTLWASLLLKRTELQGLKTPEQLIAFLVQATKNKVADKARHFRAQKRSYEREESLELHTPDGLASNRPPSSSLRSREPTPSTHASIREQWTRVISRTSERDRKIIDLRMRNHTFDEIASILNIHEHTVRRAIQKLVDAFPIV